jgi:hypothetical protein
MHRETRFGSLDRVEVINDDPRNCSHLLSFRTSLKVVIEKRDLKHCE